MSKSKANAGDVVREQMKSDGEAIDRAMLHYQEGLMKLLDVLSGSRRVRTKKVETSDAKA